MFRHNDFEGLRAELRDDGVGLIAFNRPEKLTPLTAQGLRDLKTVARRLGDNPDCGAVVISGDGRAFNSGMDLTVALSAGSGDALQQVTGEHPGHPGRAGVVRRASTAPGSWR